MIIKSMSRKTPTFDQLVNYMNSHSAGPAFDIFHNSYPVNDDSLIRDFEQNAAFVPRRKNGVYLYHEILSVTTTPEISLEKQKEKLKEIAEEYIQRRSPRNMVFGALHDDATTNLHYHFVISSNELGKPKKTRLSKQKFDGLKKDFEQWVISQYPELNQEISINKGREIHLTNKGAELKRRTGKTPQRDVVKERLSTLFDISRSKQELFAFLEAENLELYVRGKTIGFKDIGSGRKYRVKTLGLNAEFRAMSERLDLEAKQSVIDYEQAKGRKERVKSQPTDPGPENGREAESPTAHSPEKKRPPNQAQESGKETDKAEEPDPGTAKSSYNTTAREWVLGDFSERDAKARKAKFQEQAEKDRGVKDRTDQNPLENTVETGKEWLLGDFANREARTRNQAHNDRLEAWREGQEKQNEEKAVIKAREERRDELKQSRDSQNEPTNEPDKDEPKK